MLVRRAHGCNKVGRANTAFLRTTRSLRPLYSLRWQHRGGAYKSSRGRRLGNVTHAALEAIGYHSPLLALFAAQKKVGATLAPLLRRNRRISKHSFSIHE